jgi:hypothetical protein
MWGQFLFWAVAGPKHLQRFVLLWLVLMVVFFYAFVHESFDGSSEAARLPHPPTPSSAPR